MWRRTHPQPRTCLLLVVAIGILAESAYGYIDPGTQSSVVQFLGLVLAAMGVLFGLLLFQAKRLWGWLKAILRAVGTSRRARFILAASSIVIISPMLGFWLYTKEGHTMKEGSHTHEPRVIVLGMDGLDPGLLAEMMDAGQLSNFARLRHTGSFAALHTTVPPESPVAWSAIGTGCNPGKFGIYDFLHRDPETYGPLLAIYKVNTGNLLDAREKRYLPVRNAPGFWSIASQAGVPVSVFRWPVAFPPEPVSGHFVCGLGVPDLNGRLGRYSLFTTKPEPEGKAFKGRWCAGSWQGDVFSSKLIGPVVAGLSGRKEATLDVVVRRRDQQSVSLQIGTVSAVTLGTGQWSDYLPVRFSPGWGKSLPGMVRAYLVAVEPHLKLYVSTVETDPLEPYSPFTYPDAYSRELAQAVGRYTTLGMPEDVNAVKDGTISPAAFEQAMHSLFAERKKQFDYELQHFDKGLLVFVFDHTDRIQHMFWRTRDKTHPNYDEAFAKEFGHVIPDMYRQMDDILGEALGQTDANTTLIVVSDHGFNSFRRSVGLNSWLVENGYMTLTTDTGRDGQEMFADVDWTKTKAYSLGFCSVYLNLRGREKQGIVAPGADCQKLCDELAAKLRLLKDPRSGTNAILNVYLASNEYHGGYRACAPDLVVGFNAGYRAEEKNVLGASPAAIFADNTSEWSGDHLMDAHIVPGIFLSNRTLRRNQPRVIDVAPTILQCLGVERPKTMDGEPLF